jgi:hypothetical protein
LERPDRGVSGDATHQAGRKLMAMGRPTHPGPTVDMGWDEAKFRAPLAGDPIWRLREFVSGEWNPAYSLLDMLCHDRPARPS